MMDVANALFDSALRVSEYGTIANIPATGPPPLNAWESLTHIDCYMNAVISAVQGEPGQQYQVFDGTVYTLKRIFPSMSDKTKELARVKKILAGEVKRNCVKEVLGQTVDTEVGTVTLPEQNIQKLLTLLAIPATQCHIGQKDIEHLVGKLRSMHLTVTGALAHIYHIQRALAQGGGGPGLDFFGLSLGDFVLAGPCGTNIVLDYSPGQYCPPRAHPSRVLQRFGPEEWRRVD